VIENLPGLTPEQHRQAQELWSAALALMEGDAYAAYLSAADPNSDDPLITKGRERSRKVMRLLAATTDYLRPHDEALRD
jgi:hypothetical protein